MKKLLIGCFVVALCILTIGVEANPPSLSEQGYQVGIELGCSETYYHENYQQMINTVNWADQAGIPLYGEGVAIGYFNARFGALNRCLYCPNISCGPTGGGGGGGGPTPPGGPQG